MAVVDARRGHQIVWAGYSLFASVLKGFASSLYQHQGNEVVCCLQGRCCDLKRVLVTVIGGPVESVLFDLLFL